MISVVRPVLWYQCSATEISGWGTEISCWANEISSDIIDIYRYTFYLFSTRWTRGQNLVASSCSDSAQPMTQQHQSHRPRGLQACWAERQWLLYWAASYQVVSYPVSAGVASVLSPAAPACFIFLGGKYVFKK